MSDVKKKLKQNWRDAPVIEHTVINPIMCVFCNNKKIAPSLYYNQQKVSLM